METPEGTIRITGEDSKAQLLEMALAGTVAGMEEISSPAKGLSPAEIKVLVTSGTLVQGMNQGWVARWHQRGWLREASSTRPRFTALWERLAGLCHGQEVKFSRIDHAPGRPRPARQEIGFALHITGLAASATQASRSAP